MKKPLACIVCLCSRIMNRIHFVERKRAGRDGVRERERETEREREPEREMERQRERDRERERERERHRDRETQRQRDREKDRGEKMRGDNIIFENKNQKLKS